MTDNTEINKAFASANIIIDLPNEFTHELKKVVAMGAKKHGMNSYLEPGVFTEKRLASIFRHLMKVSGLYSNKEFETVIDVIEQKLTNISTMQKNNLLDAESGLSHFAHIECNAAMFETVINRGILKVDE